MRYATAAPKSWNKINISTKVGICLCIGLVTEYKELGKPVFALHNTNKCMPIHEKVAETIKKNIPRSQPVLEKAYGSPKIPAPQMVLLKLKNDENQLLYVVDHY